MYSDAYVGRHTCANDLHVHVGMQIDGTPVCYQNFNTS